VKTFIISVTCLVVGLAAGFFVGCRFYSRHVTNEAVTQMTEEMESSVGYHAAEATRVIELIDSGDRTNAVRILSRPIADYYSLYAVYTNTDRERKMRAMIDALASTNQTVAAVIAVSQKPIGNR
jgi:hypothetical protein